MQRRPQTYCKLQAAFSLEQSQSVMIVVRFHPFVRQLNLATSGNPALCCWFACPCLTLCAPRAWRLLRPLTKPVARIYLMSLAVDELVQDGLVWHSLNTFRRNGVRKTLGFLAFPGFQRFATIFDPRLCHLLALFVKRHLAPSQQHAFQFCFRFSFPV